MTASEHATERYQQDLIRRADTYFPGGALTVFYLPDELPFVASRGKGSRIQDVAGKEYLDYVMGAGPLILGHAHPRVVQAVREQLELGSTYYYLSEPVIRLAETVTAAVPCAEVVCFANSGTEATFHALRMARTYTGR